MTDDPFAKLVRPKAQFDLETKQRLASLLEPYVWIDPETNSVVYNDNAKHLNTLQQVLLFALARKVIALINTKLTGGFTPSEIETETRLPGGTIRPKLAELVKKKILVRTENGYEMAHNFLIGEIEQVFS